MHPSSWFGADGDWSLQVLWEDGERVFCRGERNANGYRAAVLAVLPAAEHPTPATLDRLAREYGLKDELDGAWAVRPLELVHDRGRIMLVLEDTQGEPLQRLLEAPMEVRSFLRLAIAVAGALAQVHRRGLVHKDIKPANILVNRTTGEVKLTGFGIAGRLPRERQAPAPLESIAGTLAYMAPEQTGRMNRSIDARSDLYALGVTLYQTLTGSLPFTAADPMEWVHCHIARKPVPPSERLETVPAAVSAIILKLLAKTAEERYQTAAGVQHDLRRCLAASKARHRIDAFPLGQQDTPDRLLIPERLYGREREVETLLASFDRIVKSGAPELVLVSGYSGIGKSSVVHELHKALVPPRGLFASGKFDQYKRNIPYSTLVQASQSLVRQLLGKSETELASWRETLLEALGPNGRLMVDLVPELNLVIGEQPPVPELPPQDAQRRFQLVFRRFIGVFARPEHPLALFLDDLQWLDAATLELLEDLLTQSDVQHLLLIGAYRDNEVDAVHPLMRKLEEIRNAGAVVHEITLGPLALEDLQQLVADSLHCEPENVTPLAQLVHEKTAGNPFFAIQFVSVLAEEEMLSFNYDNAQWSWDLNRIHAKGYTDNVVDLMAGKLTRLPAETQKALQQLACLGNVAEITTLSTVLGASEEQVHAAFWEAVRQELVERLESSYKFIHDRVQEAAYSLIPETSRAVEHLRIGRLLAMRTPPEQREEAIFEIVNQLDRGATLITAREEREQLAELNLIAGKRAKASTAYTSALTYLIAGTTLLAEDCWKRRHELIFALELNQAECELLTGALAEAEQRLAALSTRAASTVERATVASLRVDLYTTLDQSSRAIAVGLDYLRHLGIDWSPHPTEEEVRREYERIWLQLGSRTIESLIELPLMTDPASLATLEFLTKIAPPGFYTDANLLALVVCRAVNLSLERGNSDASCAAYAFLGMIAGPRFGDYQAAYRFGRLGYDLVEGRGLTRFQARVYNDFGNLVMPWTRHVRAGRDLVRRAFEAANRIGDLTYAAYCGNQLNTKLLLAGDPLAEVEREAERGLAFAQRARFGLVIERIASQLGLIRTLRGLTRTFGSFDDAHFDELRVERRLAANPDLALAEFFYWTRKLQARFFAGDYASATEASSKAQRLLWVAVAQLETAEYHFYGALSKAASCDSATAGERQQHLDAVAAHHKQLQVWAANCPDNFGNRAALVGAEIARIDGRDVDAMQLYEQAIRSARDNGFVHNEALANELAARFYAARGFEKIAHTYLRDARYGYLRWGADGKVRQLDQLYPQLSEKEPAPGPTSTIGVPVEHLDLATVIKVSQAVTGEIVLEKLIDTLMRTAIEHAGAERGLLILPRGAEQRIEAEATARSDAVIVHLEDAPVSEAALPESILQFVLRTEESVILDDASAQHPFSTDPHIRQRQARSILCLPLINQAKLIGVLYLENNLAAGVFTPNRIAVLKLLASQAAISLENARLHTELINENRVRKDAEENLRQSEAFLIQAQQISQTGSWYWNLKTGEVRWSAEHFRLFAYDPATTQPSYAVFVEPIHPEDRPSIEQTIATAVAEKGQFQLEYRIVLLDGTIKHLLSIGHPGMTESGDLEYIGTVMDITGRKRMEAEGRESELRYRELQMELAHASRVATMGQLSASIAHEINQPIAGVITNANAGLRWLGARRPNLEEARQAFGRIMRDGNRAREVIDRVRALARNAPPRFDRLDINEAIREVIALAQAEMRRNRIQLQIRLGDDLPHIAGDRVQLQQVATNLIVNAVEAMSDVSEGPRELTIVSGAGNSNDVFVEVRDTGPGLDPANLDRLFQSFYTTKPDGMGMGLAISRSIVEAHGGQLSAARNQLQGAVFRLTLPVEEARLPNPN
jgi:predicted ATPase/signal transduction histidine kinase/GAF domain-containing protein